MSNEKVIAVCKPHWASSLVYFLTGGAAVFFIIAGFFIPEMGLIISGAGAFMLILSIIGAIFARKMRYLELTETRVIGHKGIFQVKTVTAPISKIQHVSLSYGILGKALGYQTITIDTAGNSSSEFVFQMMEDADEFAELIEERIQ